MFSSELSVLLYILLETELKMHFQKIPKNFKKISKISKKFQKIPKNFKKNFKKI